MAHGARPERRVDPARARGGGPAADRGPPGRARRRRDGHRDRPDRRARVRRAPARGSPGSPPTVVLSDDDGASDRIDEFSAGDSRWMVAVRMVSEGVDVPRLAVGVYATSAPRRRCSSRRPSAGSCGPGGAARPRRCSCRASPQLLALANTLELERDHALDRPLTPRSRATTSTPRTRCSPRRTASATAPTRSARTACRARSRRSRRRRRSTACCSTAASSARAPRSAPTRSRTSSGLPGLLDADQVTTLLRQRQADQLSGAGTKAAQRRPSAGRDGPPRAGRAAQGAVAAGRGVGATQRSAARRRCTPSCAAAAAARRSPLADPDQLDGARRRCSAAGSSASADARVR